MRYLPHTPDEITEMLAKIGVPSIDTLFDPIPKNVQLGRPLAIEPGMDEAGLMAHMDDLAAKSAAAEAILMARRLTKRMHVLVSEGLHPEYSETIRTYVRGLPGGAAEIETVPLAKSGAVDIEVLKTKVREDTACVVVGYPNFYG